MSRPCSSSFQHLAIHVVDRQVEDPLPAIQPALSDRSPPRFAHTLDVGSGEVAQFGMLVEFAS